MRWAAPGSTGLLRLLGRLAANRQSRLYLVGGSVRDLLLQRRTHDLDLVVEGDAEALARELLERRGGKLTAHRRFGTVTVEVGQGPRVDIAMARREHYSKPAALPDVSPGRLADDLGRRDFSINALAARVRHNGVRGILDPWGGIADLERRSIRVLHPRSFIDDPTRAFRAARFAGRLGFTVDAPSAALIDSARREGLFDGLSPARLWRELRYLFAESRIDRVLAATSRLRLFETVDPALTVGKRERALLRRARRLLDGFIEQAPEERLEVSAIMVGLLQRHVDVAARVRILDRLRPDRRTRHIVESSSAAVGRLLSGLAQLSRITRGAADRLCAGQPLEILLIALTVAPPGRSRRAIDFYLDQSRRLQIEVDGSDLLAAGVAAGPAMAEALQAARRAMLDGRAGSREAQLEAALRAVAGRPGRSA